MDYLVDTNVLVRAMLASDPRCDAARRALSDILSRGHTLVVLPQVVAELWVVATRAESQNGLGYSPRRVERLLRRFEETFETRFEDEAVFAAWRLVVADKSVKGKQAHDARIAAAVAAQRAGCLLTFNTKDFERYDGISVVHPSEFSSE